MHTWEWGEVLREETVAFERLGVYRDGSLIGVAQAVQRPLHIGGYYWYAPRGIAMEYTDTATVKDVYAAFNAYIKSKGGAFLKVDPDLVHDDPIVSVLDALHPKPAAMFSQAERVWCVDLQKDEVSQLAWMKEHGMRSNIPYYLRRAARDGAIVRISDTTEDLDTLLNLLGDLRERKHMTGGSDEHLRRQFAQLGPKGYEKIFIAEKDGQVVAAALISIYGREASYLHGASTELFKELRIPHLLHFEIMKYLIAEHPEVERYNFWGIVSDKNRTPKHPRHGYSEFKRSFGGYKEEYMRARDFVYNPLAWRLDWLLQKYWAWKYKND
jgi:lipid II:glycine glycyltransferase (peptidoglycan interpeptide bridge formation enzyme)